MAKPSSYKSGSCRRAERAGGPWVRRTRRGTGPGGREEPVPGLVALLQLRREAGLELVELGDEGLDGALQDDVGLGLALRVDEDLRHRQAGMLDDVLGEVDVLVGQ